MSTNPWLKFYPTDWRGDAALRSVSFAARGLWMDMLSLMHEAETYGHLLVNGRAPPTARLARMLGGTIKEVTQLLDELEEQRVFSRTDDGIIYSRRMVRDHAKAARDKENGRAGGNPNIKRKGNGGVNPPPNPDDNGQDKAQIPEARSQKLEKKERGKNTPTPHGVGASDPPGFGDFWDSYPRKVGRRTAALAYAAAIKRGAKPDDIAAGLEHAQWNPEPRFQPHPTTWLNRDGWRDEYDTVDPVVRALEDAFGTTDDIDPPPHPAGRLLQ